MFEFFKSLSFNQGTNIGLIIFGIFLAPYWYIFQFANDIYKTNDFIERIILSICIGVPVSILNFFVNYLSAFFMKKQETEKEKETKIFKLMGISCAVVGISFYVPSVLSFFNLSETQHQGILSIISFHLGYIVMIAFFTIKNNNKLRNQEKV